jgi:hypothetical protein
MGSRLSPHPHTPNHLLARVAKKTNIQPAKLHIIEVKAKTYDGCLGIYRPDQACTKIAISGWQLIA